MNARPKLLVTGGAGFIGSHVVQYGLAAGYDVAIFDNFLHGSRNGPYGARVFEGDLRDRNRMFGALGAFAPDYVSHHAALIDSPGSCKNPALHFETNVMGSINLLDACVAVGSVRHLVFASSAAVYGDVPRGQMAREDSLPRPETPYGVGKLTVEHLITALYPHSGIPTTIFRYPNVFGPRQTSGVIATFIRNMLNGRPCKVHAKPDEDPEQTSGCEREYIDVQSVARANILALSRQSVGIQLFNVPGHARDTMMIAANLINALGLDKHQFIRSESVSGDVARSAMDTARFATEFFSLDGPLDLSRTVEWWRNQT